MRPGLIAATVIALTPVTAVLLLTIGLYDAFSILTWILLLITLGRNGHWQLVLGCLPASGTSSRPPSASRCAAHPGTAPSGRLRPHGRALIVGLVLGRIALEAYLHGGSVGSGSRLSYAAHWDVLSYLLGSTLGNGPLIVWSALAGLWGSAITALRRSWGAWPTGARAGVGSNRRHNDTRAASFAVARVEQTREPCRCQTGQVHCRISRVGRIGLGRWCVSARR